MNHFLFSYGTLQKEKVQLELFGRPLNGSKDILCGYKISIIEIDDESFMAKGEEKYQKTLRPSNNMNHFVEGTVFEITEEELLIADQYEPANYKRTGVQLESGKEAWIYIAIDGDE